MDKVVVAALNGIKTRIGPLIHWNKVKNRDVRRQGTVEFKHEFRSIRFDHICVKKILTGVYARVCTPATVDGGGGFQDFFKRIFYDLLHGTCVGLPLPAMIVEPVVGDMEEKAFDRS